jgi:hypothetical protein
MGCVLPQSGWLASTWQGLRLLPASVGRPKWWEVAAYGEYLAAKQHEFRTVQCSTSSGVRPLPAVQCGWTAYRVSDIECHQKSEAGQLQQQQQPRCFACRLTAARGRPLSLPRSRRMACSELLTGDVTAPTLSYAGMWAVPADHAGRRAARAAVPGRRLWPAAPRPALR